MRYENIQNFMVVNNIIVLSEYEQFIKGLKSKYGNGERIACILFADPNNDDVVSGYIDNRFDYLNERSGKYVDFFCPGYYYRQNRRKFDTKKYVKFLKDLEARSKWQYNGGTNLLLIRYCNGALHFDNVYDINFTRMTAEGLINDYRLFFEMFIREFQNIENYMDSQAIIKHAQNIWNSLSDLLPKFFKDVCIMAKKAKDINKYFLPHDYSL